MQEPTLADETTAVKSGLLLWTALKKRPESSEGDPPMSNAAAEGSWGLESGEIINNMSLIEGGEG